ncbi:hypothetical protein Ciccas_007811 [Cichlidogyrus casuarinus]|uniref:KRR1 small subunit processome component n=1 Tax=Cichlidogyrus casuarinus TaxID=1844966 RepID=A0ABD2Q267_9PLAT
MVKKTKKQELNLPVVENWVPHQPFSKNKEEVFKNLQQNEELQDVPANWKEPEFKPEDNPHGRLFSPTEFVVLFPAYREKYLSEIWSALQKILLERHIKAELNLTKSVMTVRTTPKTYDPFIIIKARDMIKMLARSVPLEKAMTLLENDMFGEIIDIKLTNKEKFIKRRNRLIGEDGDTLKAIELATGCFVLVQGKTVSAIGDYRGVHTVHGIVSDCMYNNIHPVNSLKRAIIIKKLSADPSKKDQSYERFLPKIKKKTLSKRRVPHKVRKKKDYTPFPPPIEKSKVDIALEKGTYFLSQAEQKAVKRDAAISASQEKSKKRQLEKRASAFVPPKPKKQKKSE